MPRFLSRLATPIAASLALACACRGGANHDLGTCTTHEQCVHPPFVPTFADARCLVGICTSGECTSLPCDDQWLPDDKVGDCLTPVCRNGQVRKVAAVWDTPDADPDHCLAFKCDTPVGGGVLSVSPISPIPLEAGTACADGGVCTGFGECVSAKAEPPPSDAGAPD
jgi:hypothetical protein